MNLTHSQLSEAQWLSRREAHRAEILPITESFRARRGRGALHPIYDFLFTYYNFSTKKLERWHPGLGVSIDCGGNSNREAARELLDNPLYELRDGEISLSVERIRESALRLIAGAKEICEIIESRPARFSCFGLHEYAMVYRSEEIRHQYPLRLSKEELAAFLESQSVCCSHFDAFRFFTPKAISLNVLHPSSDTRAEFEQGGCIHANMDLYKWAYKLSPLISSDLLRECFALAVAAREIDMKASPYDLASLGFAPIRVETEAGRNEYVIEQQQIATRAKPLRRALLLEISRIEAILQSHQISIPSRISDAEFPHP